jgi:hypothetical protein
MSVFAALAKAMLDVESIKCWNLVAVRLKIHQLSRLWSSPWVVFEHEAESAAQNLDCRPKRVKKKKKNVKEEIEREENL